MDAIADFSTLDIAANRTVNLGASRSIGTLIFGDATTPTNNWALANGAGGPWTLTLATSSGAPVILNGTLSVGDPSLNAVANLDLVTSGLGSIDLGAGSLLALDIFSGAGLGDQSGNANAADQLRVAGTINISPGATLKLLNPNGLTSWANGDTFKLLDWSALTSVTGSFNVDAAELQLPIGFGLDASNLYSLGIITVVVPEPGRLLLLLMSGVAFLHQRKRPGPPSQTINI